MQRTLAIAAPSTATIIFTASVVLLLAICLISLRPLLSKPNVLPTIGLLLFHGTTLLFACVKATTIGAVFVLAGRMLAPRAVLRWLGLTVFDLGLIGLTAFVLGCWAAATHDHSVRPIIVLLLLGTTVGIICRALFRSYAILNPEQLRSAIRMLVVFNAFASIFYVLHYHSLSPDSLPFVYSGNLDLMQYGNTGAWLQDAQPSGNISGYDFKNFALADAFGAFAVISLLQFLPRLNPYDFAIPALIFTNAGGALVAYKCLRRFFNLTPPIAFTVAVLYLANPLNFYCGYNYFFSQSLSTFAVMVLIHGTLSRPRGLTAIPLQMIAAAPCYILQLFSYWPGTPFVGALHLLVLTIRESMDSLDHGAWRKAVRTGMIFAAIVLVSGAVLGSAFALLFSTRIGYVSAAMSALGTRDVAGWPLGLISPYVLLGGSSGSDFYGDPHPPLFWVSYTVAVPLLFAAPFWLRLQDPAKVLALCFALLVPTYLLYYFHLGPSYRQWKFAAYGPMALCWIPIAELMLLVTSISVKQLRALVSALVAITILALDIRSNLLLPPVQVPSTIASISSIDEMDDVDSVAVALPNEPSHVNYANQTMVTLFVRRPALYMSWGVSYPRSLPSDYRPSRRFPLLTQGENCARVGDGYIRPLRGGFMLVAHDFLTLPVFIDFHQPISCAGILTGEGIGAVEPSGRWTSGKLSSLKFHIDPATITGDLRLALIATGFTMGEPRRNSRQTADVLVNGEPVAAWEFLTSGVETHHAIIPRNLAVRKSELEIAFRLPNAVDLAELTKGADKRVVALMLQSLTLAEAR